MQNELLSVGDFRSKKPVSKRQDEQALRRQRAKLRDDECVKAPGAIYRRDPHI